MTTRKPPRLSFPDWVEQQVRTAEEQGAFDNLPGKGKPIPGIDRPQHELEWIVGKLRSENVDVRAALPPALALAKEVEDLPATTATLHSAAAVRAHVEDLNKRIRLAHLAPQVGPPMRVRSVDVDQVVADWTAARAAARPAPSPPAPEPPTTSRHRWFRRRPR